MIFYNGHEEIEVSEIDKLKDSPTFKSLFGPGYKSKKMPRQAKDVKIFGGLLNHCYQKQKKS